MVLSGHVALFLLIIKLCCLISTFSWKQRMDELFLHPCTAFMVWYLCKGTFLCLRYQDKHLLFKKTMWIISEIQQNKIHTYVSLTSLCDLVEKNESLSKIEDTKLMRLSRVSSFKVPHVEKNLVPLSLNLSLNLEPFYLSWGCTGGGEPVSCDVNSVSALVCFSLKFSLVDRQQVSHWLNLRAMLQMGK